jgi:hypothetical protein
MDWTMLAVDGRVTALHQGICAGVTADGTAFVAPLRLPHARPTTYDDLVVDSFGVLGVAAEPGERARLTGRGADGRLHVWSADQASTGGDEDLAVEAAWAAPVHAARTDHLLTCHLDAGGWRVRVEVDGRPSAADLALAGQPESALAFGFHRQGPLVVAGQVGGGGPASAWSLVDVEDGWRRIHLSPAPTTLTSVAASRDGRRTWIGGTLGRRPVVHVVLPLPFRGLVRSASVPLPALDLVDPVPGRPLVLVDGVDADHPAFVAALARGNRLCWNDGTEWKALPVPDGPIAAACVSGGAVHVLVGSQVWSVEDPTSSSVERVEAT